MVPSAQRSRSEEESLSLDLKITGGTIVDGSGGDRFAGDVGIKDGRIAAFGRVEGEAARTIDAAGRVVAPGFIDIHTHYDAQIVWDPSLSISPWHGVTTVVAGNCGFSIAPTRRHQRDLILRTLERVEGMSLEALRTGVGDAFPLHGFAAYLDAVEARGTLINVGFYVGHTPVRLYVMGEDAVAREADADEIAQMCRIVREAREAGAFGFTTSLSRTQHAFDGHPIPSRLATFAEIDALFEALAAGGGGSAQASIGRLEWLDEFAAIARRHGVVFTWTALLSDIAGPGSHRPLLEQAHRLQADGYPVVPQTSPLPQEFEFTFDYPLPWERCDWIKPLLAAKPEARAGMWRDPDFVAAFRNEELTGFDASLIDWEQRAVIAEAPHDAALNERRLAEVAHLRGVDPFDLAVALSVESGLATRFRLPVLNYREDEIAEILRDPVGVIAFSDAGAHASQLCNVHYTTHLLQHWVRETGTLTLEQGVHALTGRPAEVVGLADRGRIAEGLAADLVVFDADTIAATPLRRVHDLPAGADRMICEAPGLDTVIVNGTVIRAGGRDVAGDALPGHLLRRP